MWATLYPGGDATHASRVNLSFILIDEMSVIDLEKFGIYKYFLTKLSYQTNTYTQSKLIHKNFNMYLSIPGYFGTIFVCE